MKKKVTILSFLLMFFLSLIFIFAVAQVSIAETTLNDNVNIEGELFLEGVSSGITFSDGIQQTTAATPSWHQILPAADRFELVMNNEAVLDRETGLVWQRNTEATKYDWFAAQVYCFQLFCGNRLGWRLPTVSELATLVDKSQNNPSLPNNHPFTNAKYPYWSSTTRADITGSAWGVNFYEGYIFYSDKSLELYVRAVRSGQ